MPAEVTAQQLLMLAQGYIGGRVPGGEWALTAAALTPAKDRGDAIHALVVLARRYPKAFDDLIEATNLRALASVRDLARRVDKHIAAELEKRREA